MLIAAEIGLAGSDQETLSALSLTGAGNIASMPGVRRVGRYRKLNEARSLILVELDSESACAPVSSRMERLGTTTELGATIETVVARQVRDASTAEIAETYSWPLLYTVSFDAPQDRADELARWYDEEHIPMLQQCRYWARTQRFEVVRTSGIAATNLAVHYISSIEALRSAERDAARRTEWRALLARETWFRKGRYNIWLQERAPDFGT